MSKDLDVLNQIEKLLENLSKEERERIVEWLEHKYLPVDDVEETSSITITNTPTYPYFYPYFYPVKENNDPVIFPPYVITCESNNEIC